MNKQTDMADGNGVDLTVADLLRKQSVRATFKLSLEVIDLLGVVAGQLGIKQKSLLDQLLEDKSILTRLAGEAQDMRQAAERRQKTFVMSRCSLRSINDIAEHWHIARDLLVEVSIRRLLPIIEAELAKHNKRKILFEEMQEYMRQGEKLRERARELLGVNDELYEMLDRQLTLAGKNISAVGTIIERGTAMEEW